ncbi:MAG: 3-deoxy-manno-octulosonate cytidylyltransferase [Candidatus Cloacimonetes bacterium]|nr:3-deoxy-manno-octulosonate cytidylyltransferase [Candidatus Cloacimonadota bacterium]
MHITAIIPARYASTRLPAKALRLIAGKTLIQRVFEAVFDTNLFSKVIVATDHSDIFEHVKCFHDEVMMTSIHHPSGTDRIAECSKNINTDLIINVQGDEPFISKKPLHLLINTFKNENIHIASMMTFFDNEDDLINPNFVKVVCDKNFDALYFSRAIIPYSVTGFQINNSQVSPISNQNAPYYRHIGVYAYRPQMLKTFVALPQSNLEKIEKLEQLRLLENGYKIRMVLTDYKGIGIDTVDDLERAEKILQIKN